MNRANSKTIIVGLIAIGFILGIGTSSGVYWLIVAPQVSEADTPILADTGKPMPQELNASKRISVTVDPSLETVRNLDDLEEIKSSFHRDLALRSLLADSDESRVAELLKQTQKLSPYGTIDTQSAIVQRLANINPQLALTQVLEMSTDPYWPYSFVASIFREWANSNLDEAVAQARTLEEHLKEPAVRSIVRERTDLSEDVLRSIARELGHEQLAIVAIAEQKIEEAIADPEKAWNELAIDLQSNSQHLWSIARVASAWVEQSGLSVLDQISNSLTNLATRQFVVRSVLTDAANTNPEGAFRYALTLENDQYNSTIRGVADSWARSDPHSAFAAASDIEKKSLRSTLEDSIIRTWAYYKPREVLDGIDGLPEHVKATALAEALSTIVQDSPQEAVQLVAGIEDSEAKKQVATSVARNWSYGDHNAALDWVLNDPSVDEIRTDLLQDILHRVVQADPQLAMDTALSQPIDEEANGVGMELQVIASLTYSNLDKAIELLPQVRKGPTTVQAVQRVSQYLIRNEEVDEALDLVQQVDEPDRLGVYSAVASSWAYSDPTGLLNSMNRLPSREVRSKAAMAILSHNLHQKNLTDEQIEEAKKFLTEEDLKTHEEEEAVVSQH
ncbi:MAG: hypothetical protein OXG24_02445 [Gammaproteobacteria bacterium]|nr:hypothetical protein [Gammaproteobacteria bacterium]